MKSRKLEIMIGVIVVLASILFVVSSLFTIYSNSTSTYNIKANFNDVTSLNIGDKVMYKGIEVGVVSAIYLDDIVYDITVDMKINNDIKIPTNSSFKINAPLFIGSANIELIMGSSSAYVEENDKIVNTVDSISLEDKIGSMFLAKK